MLYMVKSKLISEILKGSKIAGLAHNDKKLSRDGSSRSNLSGSVYADRWVNS